MLDRESSRIHRDIKERFPASRQWRLMIIDSLELTSLFRAFLAQTGIRVVGSTFFQGRFPDDRYDLIVAHDIHPEQRDWLPDWLLRQLADGAKLHIIPKTNLPVPLDVEYELLYSLLEKHGATIMRNTYRIDSLMRTDEIKQWLLRVPLPGVEMKMSQTGYGERSEEVNGQVASQTIHIDWYKGEVLIGKNQEKLSLTQIARDTELFMVVFEKMMKKDQGIKQVMVIDSYLNSAAIGHFLNPLGISVTRMEVLPEHMMAEEKLDLIIAHNLRLNDEQWLVQQLRNGTHVLIFERDNVPPQQRENYRQMYDVLAAKGAQLVRNSRDRIYGTKVWLLEVGLGHHSFR